MEPTHSSKTTSENLILIISGSCCIPKLAVLDQQVQQIIQQALRETGITAQVRTVTASSAVRGGIPSEILQSTGLANDTSNIMRLPAVLINNQFVSFGVPQLDVIKNALLKTQK